MAMADGITTRLQKEVTQLQKEMEKLDSKLEKNGGTTWRKAKCRPTNWVTTWHGQLSSRAERYHQTKIRSCICDFNW